MKISEILKKVKVIPKDEYGDIGICGYIQLIDPGTFTRLLVKAFMIDSYPKWPKFSGDLTFPIPPPKNRRLSPMVYYMSYPKWKGHAKKLRHELLDFLIAEAEIQGL